MRKALSILFSVVLLMSGISISIDRHFCGGNLVDVKVSLDGNLASCGMEKPADLISEQTSMNKKCCEDQLTWYNLSNKYLPEYSRISPSVDGKDMSFALPPDAIIQKQNQVTRQGAWKFPPGQKLKSDNILSEICILRI
jgi:hypothetical protein